jgi:Tol biopolymer transport system component/tRNA A-37 threonylcarbamoyl transferase component Bud32
MTLAGGTKLGPYEIISPLGAGGMGEVYRARDTNLNREVALKVLPNAFASDAERMARFQREAKVLASLNHPNIASIYGLESSGGTPALVMELVEGPTLAERISVGAHGVRPSGETGTGERISGSVGARRTPLQVDEALGIAKQIAEALEAAHEKGIVHRDLKPANVKITPEGTVKVLDFGLAKAMEDPVSSADPANSPTLSIASTRAGVIMGTAAYMAPEQARGHAVDRRADIWSFGVVLYEMLAGRQAFEGETTSDILASVLKFEPDWKALPEATPPAISKLLRRCLTKDRKKRLQSMGEARITIEETLTGEALSPGPAPAMASDITRPPQGATQRGRALPWAVAAVAILIALILAVALWRATRPVEQPLTRLTVDLGPEAMTGLNLTTAISPDGRRLVFEARGPNGKPQLASLVLDQAQATLLQGTENGNYPFFSPDGEWIGFIADGQLKKISIQGGAPVSLCPVGSNVMGASWGDNGIIAFASGTLSALSQIPAAGGTVQPLTTLTSGEITHRWPQVLPGSGAVLFTASSSITAQDDAYIEAISLKTGQVKILQRGGYFGRYLPGGYLVYLHQGVLFGVEFDLERLVTRGTPTPLLEDVAANASTGGGQFDFSKSGTFVYVAGKGAAQSWRMVWLDSSGKEQPIVAAPGIYSTPRVSPDGRKVAYVGEGSDVYIHDLERNTTSRLTFTGRSLIPVWSPDSKHLIYRTTGTEFSISWARSDGAGEPQQLLVSKSVLVPWSISSDGRHLAYFENDGKTDYDLWTLPLDLTDPEHPKPGKPELFLRTPAGELVPRFSIDGRWIAYRSDESGKEEIYVRPFPPGNGGKWQISSGGGLYAVWSKDGRELFYETADYRIMVMDYTVEGGSFVPGTPRLWSDKALFYSGASNLDLAPDGKRFVALTMPETNADEKRSVHVTMLLNYFDEIRRRLAK